MTRLIITITVIFSCLTGILIGGFFVNKDYERGLLAPHEKREYIKYKFLKEVERNFLEEYLNITQQLADRKMKQYGVVISGIGEVFIKVNFEASYLSLEKRYNRSLSVIGKKENIFFITIYDGANKSQYFIEEDDPVFANILSLWDQIKEFQKHSFSNQK